jgi:energy-coupling factor transporter ATP-binding protein EcfA2
MIILGLGLIMTAYVRWFKPMPIEVVNLTNLDRLAEQGSIEKPIGCASQIHELEESLFADSCIFLVGPTGVGKTALLNLFTHLKLEGKLLHRLQKLTTHEMNCGTVLSNVNVDHSESFASTKQQIAGFEKDTLIICDEFFQIVKHQTALRAFKSQILNNSPHPLVIGIMTDNEFREMLVQFKVDIDTFTRRLEIIELKDVSDDQIELMLRSMIQKEREVPIDPAVIAKIVEISADKTYLPEIGRHDKAKMLLSKAIRFCLKFYDRGYKSLEIEEIKKKKQALRLEATSGLKVDSEKTINYNELRNEHKTVKNQHSEDFQKIQKVKTLFQEKMLLNHKFAKEMQRIRQLQKLKKLDNVTEKDKIRYLLIDFYARTQMATLLKKRVEQTQKSLKTPISFYVNLDVIETIHNKFLNQKKIISSYAPVVNQ